MYEVLASLKDIDVKNFNVLFEILRKKKISDILEFFSTNDIQMQFDEYIGKN